ncbi:MAG TPA: hypothetical protein EYP98_06060 [Planctomycetes bacterium]|nr:hypothetical protein [Planctomycetota bacterium]
MPVGGAIAETIAPLLIVNPYGVFATTTTTRPEIIIEGSDDGRTWRPYVLPYMPGPVDRAPTWNIPYQPRLDWQMWFASYQGLQQSRWIERLMQRLLENSEPVLGLFEGNPFPNNAPRLVRAQLYEYRFAAPGGERRLDGAFFPAVSLETFKRPLQGPAGSTLVPGMAPGPGEIGR